MLCPPIASLIPEASTMLLDVLGRSEAIMQSPIRAEIFGLQRFAQHGRSLGETHRAAVASGGAQTFFPRLRSNIHALHKAHRYIGLQAQSGYEISPAAEWLLDNFHLIEAQLREIHEGLPRRYFRALPLLLDEPLAGLPRIYGVTWAFVAHTDGAFDEDLLAQFLGAYQETRELKLSEMWALPTTLRVVLIENLRRLAERLAANKAAREAANLCCDHLDRTPVADLDHLLAQLVRRGMAPEFLVQMAQRLREGRRSTVAQGDITPYLDWLDRAVPDLPTLQAQLSADQAADNLSVSNAVTSLRALGDAQWPDIIARTSRLMQLMLTSVAFEREHTATRDQTLHGIERLARQWQRSELSVAQTLLNLMQTEPGIDNAQEGDIHVGAGHWLSGAGRPEMLSSLGVPSRRFALASCLRTTWARHGVLPVYLGALLLGTVGLVVWLLGHFGVNTDGTWPWLGWLGAALMLFPASEAVVAVVNRVVSESARPQHLPRLALGQGIPPEHRVMVVIPALLSDTAAVSALVHRLELHFLANPEHQAQFALLSDWADANHAQSPADEPLLAQAQAEIRDLNAQHAETSGPASDAPATPRFIVLHRPRQFSESEQRWIGWERKRGKLEQLVAALALGQTTAFLDLGPVSRIAANTRYIVTLDSDTQLPPGRLRELVGVAAHPHNQPRLDASGRRVISGYGILQPRVVTPLPARREATLFHWLFAGQCGIDPYSAATSEVYQDLFGEGSFSGKGLLHVQTLHAVLAGRLPEGQVLSHDLLEGAIARCAAVSDITVVEDAPFRADVAAARVHRWTRGDWQLLPILLSPRRCPLHGIHRWKLLDNLRRSLVAPASLGLLVMALCGWVLTPGAALTLVTAAFMAGPLMGALAGLSPSRDHAARWHFYHQAGIDLARALGTGLWQLWLLLESARQAIDAITRALYRTTVSHRHLLQWTTAATAQAQMQTRLAPMLRRHATTTVLALGLGGLLLAVSSPNTPPLIVLLCLGWATSPLGIWWVSRPQGAHLPTPCTPSERTTLNDIARDTWRFFEHCVGPVDHHLPPDNLQVLPHQMVAHRTSPTNIGLYLLSAACARQFGWIGTQDLLTRLQATLNTLDSLERHRGHFFNWYDTQTCAPLLPMYVSTVDSGNLSGHLLAVAQACKALALAPLDASANQRALDMSRQRLTRMLPHWPTLLPPLQDDAALARVLTLSDPLADGLLCMDSFGQLLQEAETELIALRLPTPAPATSVRPPARDVLVDALGDHLATLRSARLDVRVAAYGGASTVTHRLHTAARKCAQLAWAADFRFLYQRQRHLFHIGYRVAEQQLDAGFYDLLASEARLTSLLAIAKGDVPVNHWAALGRPFYVTGVLSGLRSWSGSMFEYLMPSLVLDEPPGSVLQEAGAAALREQIHFAQSMGMPWGLSESACADRDHTLAYQYAPHGVPQLALRRTPIDQWVVAPYATALAAQIAPHRAVRNFAALEALGARGRYGFIEALDYSAARQSVGETCTPVGTFMSHHQGMSIVALANVLLDGVALRWGMATAHVQAVSSLLHERAPREVSKLHALPSHPPLQALQRCSPGLRHEVLPGQSAIEPTHLLSNGRYGVSLRANGAGWSRWGASGLTRWRDDALRDAHGSFFYLRRLDLARPEAGQANAPLVSLTQHPAPDPTAHYKSTFHADRVCFDATWPQMRARITVWVSPEDDIEFREVELHNQGDQPIALEFVSAFDVTLSDPRADEAHPAFTNLFVRAAWLPTHQALLFERKPRLATEQGLHAAHFLADCEPSVLRLRGQTDRHRWQGRNRDRSQPQGALDDLPDAAPGPLDILRLDTGLDPVCALGVRVHLAPQGSARLTFATAASDNAGTLRAVVDKYRQHSHVQRASLMSATLTDIRLRALRISADNFIALQTLTTAMVLNLTRPLAPLVDLAALERPNRTTSALTAPVCKRQLLWRFGLSGDRPIILVTASAKHSLNLLRALAQGLRLWAWAGVASDLVVLNAEAASYQMTLQHELSVLRERHSVDSGPTVPPLAGTTSFLVLRIGELSANELHTLQTLARVQLHADGRPLRHRVRAWTAQHEQDLAQRHHVSTTQVGMARTVAMVEHTSAPQGEFVAATGEFSFEVGAHRRPLRPWINVMANPGFGTQLSESGSGCTWAGNSRLNQLTAWSNDPVADPPAEWILLQNLKTRETWSVAPSAWGAIDKADDLHQVSHGQGWSRISHRRGDVDVVATWCVDPQASVKQVHVQLVNRGSSTLQLRMIGLAEWMLGASRQDRSTVSTALYRQRLPDPAHQLTALLATQGDHVAGFGNGTAFLAMTGSADERDDWTCDRREFFDARGQLVMPDHFGQRSGQGLDPCAALSTTLVLAAGESDERVLVLGHADSPDAARHLATVTATVPATTRLQAVHDAWDHLLGATQVKTPDPLFDAMVNRWLLYQTVSCRLWAKASFYQAGGATGFRDQLQDTLALAWAAPHLLRTQIVLCASRQFVEGDVQHWWHAPTGAGVRTHFSDDLLWLPHAITHYLRATGDVTVLDEAVPFLDAAPIPRGAEDRYDTPRVSAKTASVYEHAARTLDHSLRVGIHGLPLMGSGDWNDGMNRVGFEGRGESVWLGWFLCQQVADWAPLAQSRADHERAQRWNDAAHGWRAALAGPAWDGQWFKRAFFDDGQVLGSHANAEARIDLIAQAWAVLSHSAPPKWQHLALAAVEVHLVDAKAGLIKLLDPPFEHAQPSAGYIQAYPPGVRENGGQYSHASVWALMAQAQAADGNRPLDAQTRGDTVYRYFTYLSPAHRAAHPTRGAVYGLEPYAMAGDVYSQPPYAGRGGWSWYTGAAAWLHRAAIESMFGLQLGAQDLCLRPCLPSHWPQAELTLRREHRQLRFIVTRVSDPAAMEALLQQTQAQLLHPGETLRWRDLCDTACVVVPLTPTTQA